MRSRLVLFALSFFLTLSLLGCTSKPSSNDNNSNPGTPSDNTSASERSGNERKEPRKRTVVVPAGTTITVSLGSAIGSKLSQPGQSFSASVEKDVLVDGAVAIPQGANATGTVTDAKPLGRFAGGAALKVKLDSITVNGRDLPVQASLKNFAAKGKGKRTAVMTGGGAALGGIIGGLAGGGKGAAIGLLAGGGAGAGGAAFTGNKDIVLPAESALSFELSQPLDVR